ncbi:ABC transporter ATP-binding protein [Virgibacillus indicus]|uniref:ABC transporter ATP-binding protein n=1 Tax=Virgibacillus indicus TaxID=2024554 RepID=A0A265NGI9_9BACI|nr:ABC transporter ATP-binding protein [Virgibacillus indicus]OZU90599.1 ABC transporter ATP-binding protein [Virgibacillus indicus]
MRNVFSFLKPYKFPIIIAYSLMLVELAVELLLPFFLGLMINDGVINQDLNNIIMWGSIMIGLAFAGFVAGIFNSFYSSHVSFAFGYDIRQKLFEKIQEFSFKNLNQYPTSALITRFTNDVRQIQNTIFMGLRIMVKAPLIVLGGVIMAFAVNVQLSLVFLVTVPLLIGFILWVLKIATRLFDKVQRNVDNVNRVMQENLAGMRLIKAFLRRDHEESRFVKANSDLANITRSTFRFVEASMPILLFVMNLSLIFIIWFGNIQSLAGNISVGEVVTIVNYALRVSMAISMFTFIILAFSRTKASSERISEVLTVDVDLTYREDANKKSAITKGKIEYKDVFFNYPSSNESVLKGISFTINPGEKLAIIGATGAGKTSLFQLIPRLYDTTGGKILVDDKPIASYTLDNLRGSIGYVPQSPLLFTGSITDNIAWGKNGATTEEIIQSAKDAQIHDTIMDLSHQYETKVGQKGVNLSGGQKQRISIARALIRKPKVLMLDDSTSALDLATEDRLLDAIQHYDCTTLIITQKISTAINADRILLMDDGEVLAVGTHKELLKQSELYQQIVESQFGKEYAYAK